MTLPLITPITDWYCPQCGLTDQTREARPHDRFHVCPKLRYMSAPMVRQGTVAKIELHERQDYIGTEMVQLYEGRPVMNMETTRDEGTDLRVFAPTAHAKLS